MSDDSLYYTDLIITDPAVCHGEPRVRGTRIPASVVLDNLAAGMTPDEIVASYQGLDREGVMAAIAYAAEVVRERIVPLLAPAP